MTRNPLDGALRVMSGWRTDARPDHQGIDLTADVGDPVYSVRPGRVKVITGDTGSTGPGCSIIVQHDLDDETRYNHLLRRPRFRVGATITEDIQIGRVGMTGRTTAPHLHFARYRLVRGQWRDVNPSSLLDFNAAAGGISPSPIPLEAIMSEATIIVERANSQKAKGVFDRETGKITRELHGAAESSIWRGVQSAQTAADLQVVFVKVTDKHYAELKA